jgi:hypothetical protein
VSQEQKSATVSDDESDRAGIGPAATSLGGLRSNVGLPVILGQREDTALMHVRRSAALLPALNFCPPQTWRNSTGNDAVSGSNKCLGVGNQ